MSLNIISNLKSNGEYSIYSSPRPQLLGRLRPPLHVSATHTKSANMCFGSSKDTDHDPYWWGYIDDGQGWTARRKSEYMKTPEYNKDLRRQMREQRKANGGRVAVPSSAYRKNY